MGNKIKQNFELGLERSNQVSSALSTLSKAQYEDDKATLPPECWEKVFKHLDNKSLKNISSLFFKSASVADEISETSKEYASKP